MNNNKTYQIAFDYYEKHDFNSAIKHLKKLHCTVPSRQTTRNCGTLEARFRSCTVDVILLHAECLRELQTLDSLKECIPMYEYLIKQKNLLQNVDDLIRINYIASISKLTNIYFIENKLDIAIDTLLHADTFVPNNHTILYNIGHLYKRLGKFDIAIKYLEKALQINKTHLDTYVEIINIYSDSTKNDSTCSKKLLDCIYLGIKNIGDDPELYNFLGVYQLNYVDDKNIAIKTLKKALDLCDEKLADIKTKIVNNIGCAYSRMGNVEKSLDYYSSISDINTESLVLLQNNTMSSLYLCDVPYKNILKLHLETGQKLHNFYCDHKITLKNYHHSKIRIGYVSGDLFGSHPMTHFVKALLNEYNHDQFQIYCYCIGNIGDNPTYSKNISWCCIKYSTLSMCVKKIMDDEIDILIDLSGHTSDNKMNIFANRLAKIQLSYLGYPCITGMPEIDYFMIDKTFNFQNLKTISLPHCFTHYTPPFIPSTLIQPYYENHHIVFGSFNKPNKINANVAKLWDRVLDAYPNAILLLKQYQNVIFKNSDRVKIIELKENYNEYLEQYNHIDIALDTFPYAGTTTTCECLLMGTPVITLADRTQNTVHQNTTASLLINSNLPELVAISSDEYIANIQKVYVQIKNNHHLKYDIQQKFLTGYVTNTKQYLNDFETLMQNLYTSKC